MAKARKYKGSSVKGGNGLTMSGVSELLKKIEKAGGRVDAACTKAANETMRIVGEHSQNFMAQHKDTGETYGSYEQTPAKIEGDKVIASVGYNIDKGGLPSIFLDVGVTGTPKRPPRRGYFWRYYALNDSGQIKRMHDAQQKALNEILEGLK